MKKPIIKTELPGPKASKLISIDKDHVSPSYTRDYPLVVEKGEGIWVQDVDGNIFLDFTAGIAVCATGHCHPRVSRQSSSRLRSFCICLERTSITLLKLYWRKSWLT